MSKKQSANPKKKTGPSMKQKAGALDQAFAIAVKDFAGMLSIFFLALIAYFPSIHGKPLWDDANYLTGPALQSEQGLWHIWTEFGVTQHYFPLLHSAFWIEHFSSSYWQSGSHGSGNDGSSLC